MEWKKRFYCGDINASQIGRTVLLMGWVDAIRDHGNVIFIHLRDISGIVQVVFDSKVDKTCYDTASDLKEEYAIEVRGEVTLRDEGTENPNIETGNIEVVASSLSFPAVTSRIIAESSTVFVR